MTRTADDSWDLASSVGATATAVVDGELAADDDPLLNRQAMSEQIAVRTRFFDDFFTMATASGIRQAVILASGLDTRAYRLPWPAGTDRETPHGGDRPPQRLAKGVAAGGFRPSRADRVEPEGLLVYLPPEAQDRLFDNITELSAPGSQIATEHMDMSEMPDDWADKLTERTTRIGSGINPAELFYTGERNGATDYLSSHGWQNAILPTAEAYAANGFELPDDELATFGGDSGHLTSTYTWRE